MLCSSPALSSPNILCPFPPKIALVAILDSSVAPLLAKPSRSAVSQSVSSSLSSIRLVSTLVKACPKVSAVSAIAVANQPIFAVNFSFSNSFSVSFICTCSINIAISCLLLSKASSVTFLFNSRRDLSESIKI